MDTNRLIALIPSGPSPLYSTFGVDIFCSPDPEIPGDDAEHVEWIDLGPFDLDAEGDPTEAFTDTMDQRAGRAAAAAGYRIDFTQATRVDDPGFRYWEYSVAAI